MYDGIYNLCDWYAQEVFIKTDTSGEAGEGKANRSQR